MTTPYSFMVKNSTIPGGEEDVFFTPDGMNVLVVDTNDRVRKYHLGSAYDLTSMTLVETSPATDVKANDPCGIHISPDGMDLFLTAISSTALVHYRLPSPWSVSSLTWVRSFSLSGTSGQEYSVTFNPSGTKFYISSQYSYIREYAMSTAWDISTAVLTSTYTPTLSSESMLSMWFSADGKRVFHYQNNEYVITLLNLSTAWDLSSWSYGGIEYTFSENAYELANLGFIYAIHFSPTEHRLFVVCYDRDLGKNAIWQYSSQPIVSLFWTNFHGQTEIE